MLHGFYIIVLAIYAGSWSEWSILSQQYITLSYSVFEVNHWISSSMAFSPNQ